MRIAVTRALPDGEATAARLRERGAEPIVAPLLTIAPCSYNTSSQGVQALAFTSANGARAFPVSRETAKLPVFAVGEATAEAARAAGFRDVRSADGDVGALAALIGGSCDPAAGAILHIGGAQIAGDLVGALQKAGFKTERRIAYAAVAVADLPQALRGPLDRVLFHSARAADIFASLGKAESPRLVAVCLSENVAAAARKVSWARIIVAPAPREDALLDAALQA